MRVGLDTFTIRESGLTPIGQLDWIAAHCFAGAQFGKMPDDLDAMRRIRRHADSLGLYSHISVSSVNPHRAKDGPEARRDEVVRQIRLAAECGWHELATSLGGPEDRYRIPVPWTTQLADSVDMLHLLAPVLREHGSRINLEPHGEATTFELVRIVEHVGPDVAGICLDTANVLCFAEDPVAAARRVAPFVHLTHAKDAIVFFAPKGVRRQGRPPGQGVVDWPRILPILAEHQPDLPLSIEDHKWFFDADIFDPAWHAGQPDLSRAELAEFVQLAWSCQRRIVAGELPGPEEYEAVPYLEQMKERLRFGREYLVYAVRQAEAHRRTGMQDVFSLGSMRSQPQQVTAVVERKGQTFTLRLLAQDDAARLAKYFTRLSSRTRSWFAPHKFDEATACQLCRDLLAEQTLRLVAVTGAPEPKFAAYFLLQFGVRPQDAGRYETYGLPLNDATDCTLAPSVADAFQSFGLGSALMQHAIGVARKAGRRRIVLFGGVNADNAGAVHFYEKFGFRTVATFGSPPGKHDMILDLATGGPQA